MKLGRTFIKNNFLASASGGLTGCWAKSLSLLPYNLYAILFKVVKLMYLFSAYAVIILINCGQFEGIHTFVAVILEFSTKRFWWQDVSGIIVSVSQV